MHRPATPTPQWQGSPRRPILRKPVVKRKETPKIVFRMQSPDPEPVKRTRLAMPSPERLGLNSVSAKKPAPLDWNAVWTRLKQMKASGFRVDNQPDGRFRVTLILPSSKSNQHFQIEAMAADELQAVQTVLHRAEQWAVNDR